MKNKALLPLHKIALPGGRDQVNCCTKPSAPTKSKKLEEVGVVGQLIKRSDLNTAGHSLLPVS